MVFLGEDVGLAFVPAQLNNNFNFNWLLKKVYVSSRRVFPNTTGFAGTPNELLGSFCRVYWGPGLTDWQMLPTLDFAGDTSTSAYYYRLRNTPPPGSQYIYYTDRYRCATVGVGGNYVESYDLKMMSPYRVQSSIYSPEDPYVIKTSQVPEYLLVSWLQKDSVGTNIDFRGAVAYAIVIVKGDYSTFKADFDALNGFVFLNSASVSTERVMNILDPVASDTSRDYEYVHSGYRTTNKLLTTFVSDGDTYSIVAMKGKLSSQPAYPDQIITKCVSQPYLITDMNAGVPVPERVLLLGAEYYGF